jgi:decaprenylphospho-beta-D-ribofuranose 2-oxidase
MSMPAGLGARRVLLRGWGRSTASAACLTSPGSADAVDEQVVADLIRSAPPRGLLARGLGRSYGDAASNGGGVVLARLAPQAPLVLDRQAGTVRVSAGTSLRRILAETAPAGWTLPVLPGTAAVTAAGAVAADVHGKDHPYRGSFGSWVTQLTLVDGTGAVHDLRPETDPAAFWGTVGGMGLTGVLTAMTLRLVPAGNGCLQVSTERFTDLDQLLARMSAPGADRHQVAWLDCLHGRSYRAVLDEAAECPGPPRHRGGPDRRRTRGQGSRRPVAPPVPVCPLTPATVAAFNAARWLATPRRRVRCRPAADYHFPLDSVAGWNRLYGPRGFLQYQFVVPDGAESLLTAALEGLRGAGQLPFLSVLKRMGPAGPGPLAFGRPGWSLAMDLPVGREGLAAALDRLDEAVAGAAGRVYLAKDGRLRPAAFAAMYPDAKGWRETRARLDPAGRLRSDLSRRLGLA